MTEHWLGEFWDPTGFALFGLARTMPDWAYMRHGSVIVHLGPGAKHIRGTQELDYPEYDADNERLPYSDATVDGIIATHVLEHLADPRHILREAGRVLRDGAPFSILVPHAQSTSYLQDLDHKTPFVVDTWKTLLDDSYYTLEKEGFPFEIGANFLFGLTERNLSVVTQLIRKAR